MRLLPRLFLAAIFLTAVPAQADITIACGGYAPSINDHVEWDLRISGTQADRGDERFKVSETKRFYILTRHDAQIRINKAAKTYVILGPKGRKAPAIEYSRHVPGEGCEISKIGPPP